MRACVRAYVFIAQYKYTHSRPTYENVVRVEAFVNY